MVLVARRLESKERIGRKNLPRIRMIPTDRTVVAMMEWNQHEICVSLQAVTPHRQRQKGKFSLFDTNHRQAVSTSLETTHLLHSIQSCPFLILIFPNARTRYIYMRSDSTPPKGAPKIVPHAAHKHVQVPEIPLQRRHRLNLICSYTRHALTKPAVC